MLLTIHIIITVGFVLLGILFSMGKGAGLIAGYNTYPRKEEYDEKALCRFMGKLMFAIAVSWSIIASSEIFGKTYLLFFGLAVFFVTAIAGVIYMSTGSRFRK